MSGSATGLELHCDKCEKTYTHPKRLANHALHCQGKVRTRGRIDLVTSARLTFLDQLRAARGQIDSAIAAVEALA